MTQNPSAPINHKQCQSCGNGFLPTSGPQKWCLPCVTGNCILCGNQFKKRHLNGNLVGIFCSQKCQSDDRISRGRVSIKCTGCDKILSRIRGQLRFSPRPFCTNGCKAKHFWTDPEFKIRVGKAISDHPYHSSQAKLDQLLAAARKNRLKPVSEETRAKIRAARLKQRFPTKMTSIEQILHDAFQKQGWKFSMHATMFDRWQPDFVFPEHKVVVHADGEYWHDLPAQRLKDSEFDTAAKTFGWASLRFRGKRIKNHLDDCLVEISQHLRHQTEKALSPVPGED